MRPTRDTEGLDVLPLAHHERKFVRAQAVLGRGDCGLVTLAAVCGLEVKAPAQTVCDMDTQLRGRQNRLGAWRDVRCHDEL